MTTPLRIRLSSCPYSDEGLDTRLVNQKPGQERRLGEPLEIQAVIFEDDVSRFVMVGADLIWFSDAMAESLRSEIAERVGCPPAAVSLTTTHSHGTPQTDPRFEYGENPKFAERLEAAVVDCVTTAMESPPQLVRLVKGDVSCEESLSVNRRRSAPYVRGGIGCRVQNLPNDQRKVDDRVTVIAALNEADKPICLISHFACHPVLDTAGTYGSDFPGNLRRRLRQALGEETICLYLQGYCGDVRPNLVHSPSGLKDRILEFVIGKRFRPSTEADMTWFTDVLSQSCLSTSDMPVSDWRVTQLIAQGI